MNRILGARAAAALPFCGAAGDAVTAIAAVIIWTFEHNVNSEFDPMFVSGGGLLEGLYNLQLIYKTE